MPAAPIIGAVAAAVGAGAAVYSGYTSNKAQKEATRQAQQQAKKQAELADQEFNRANQKKADTNKMLAANQQASMSGQAGTMLTGPQGVAPGNVDIGKATLLGQ